MAQAEIKPTASAPAAHPIPSNRGGTAIPTQGYRTAIEAAHAAFIAAITNEQPEPIRHGWASPGEIEDRSRHIHNIMQAVHDYVVACTEEAADNSDCGEIDYNYHSGLLSDAASEITGELNRCAHDMRETSDYARAIGGRR